MEEVEANINLHLTFSFYSKLFLSIKNALFYIPTSKILVPSFIFYDFSFFCCKWTISSLILNFNMSNVDNAKKLQFLIINVQIYI